MSVALGITSKKIKIITLQGRRVKKWASADLPDGLVRDGLILQPKAVGEAITALFKANHISRDNVITGMAGLPFTYRFLKLPRMKSSLLDEAIFRAARKEISLPLDELYLSWQQIPNVTDELSFFVLGVQRTFVDALVDTLKAAGIEPYLMGLRPLALARVAERSNGILVNVQADCFDIVFMSGGIPRVIHTVNPRGDGTTLEDNIHRLADEITKTAAFYQSNNPDAVLDANTPLLLTGEWASNATVTALLQAEVIYPVQPLIAKVEIPETMEMGSFAPAIGLALKKAPSKIATNNQSGSFVDVNINILEGKYRKPKAKPIPLSQVLLWVLLAAAVITLYPLHQTLGQIKNNNAAQETSLTDINRQIKIVTAINGDNLATENTIQTLNTTAAAVENAYSSTIGTRGDYTKDMETVTSLIPPPILFTTLEILPEQITIAGEADSTYTVISYATALGAQGIFQSVRISGLNEASSSFLFSTESGKPVPVNIIQFEIIIQKYAPATTQ